MALDQVRQPVQQAAAFGRGRLPPRSVFEGLARGAHGVIDIGGIGFSHLADDLSRGRIDGGKSFAGLAATQRLLIRSFVAEIATWACFGLDTTEAMEKLLLIRSAVARALTSGGGTHQDFMTFAVVLLTRLSKLH